MRKISVSGTLCLLPFLDKHRGKGKEKKHKKHRLSDDGIRLEFFYRAAAKLKQNT